MPKYTITYFDGRGRAEISRLILAYNEIEFEDSRFTREEWPAIKPTLPYGQVPVLTLEDGTMLCQSLAIARYLAREHDLVGKNNLESALADSYVDAMDDIFKGMMKLFFGATDEEKKAAKEACEKSVPVSLGLIEKSFDKQGTEYLAGNSLTWADLLYAIGLAELKRLVGDSVADGCPKLLALEQKVLNIPQVKTYLENRKDTEF